MTSIRYTNNAEYRAIFRQITGQPSLESAIHKPESEEDPDDEETRDESTYDDTLVSGFLETVYRDTRTNPLFQRLYLAAAAKMLTEKPEIGMAILCSYDYLWAFYPCYCVYRENPDNFSQTNHWYCELANRLIREP